VRKGCAKGGGLRKKFFDLPRSAFISGPRGGFLLAIYFFLRRPPCFAHPWRSPPLRKNNALKRLRKAVLTFAFIVFAHPPL
jgi:hypothetical protein